MSRRNKCGCKYSTTSDADVRKGLSLNGSLIEECEQHRAQRLAPREAMTDTMSDERALELLHELHVVGACAMATNNRIEIGSALDHIATRLAAKPVQVPEKWEVVSMTLLAEALEKRGDDLSTDAASWLRKYAAPTPAGDEE